MPTDEGSGRCRSRWIKGAYTLTADAAPTEPDEMQGMLRVQAAPDCADPDRQQRKPCRAFRVLTARTILRCCKAGDSTAAVPVSRRTSLRKPFTVAVKNGGGLLPKGKLEVWRDGDALRFFRRDKGLYTGKGSLQSG